MGLCQASYCSCASVTGAASPGREDHGLPDGQRHCLSCPEFWLCCPGFGLLAHIEFKDRQLYLCTESNTAPGAAALISQCIEGTACSTFCLASDVQGHCQVVSMLDSMPAAGPLWAGLQMLHKHHLRHLCSLVLKSCMQCCSGDVQLFLDSSNPQSDPNCYPVSETSRALGLPQDVNSHVWTPINACLLVGMLVVIRLLTYVALRHKTGQL